MQEIFLPLISQKLSSGYHSSLSSHAFTLSPVKPYILLSTSYLLFRRRLRISRHSSMIFSPSLSASVYFQLPQSFPPQIQPAPPPVRCCGCSREPLSLTLHKGTSGGTRDVPLARLCPWCVIPMPCSARGYGSSAS